MVKKTDDVQFDDIDLDDVDFGSIDDTGEDMSFDMKDDRDPVTVAKDKVKSSLNEKLFDTSWLRQLLGMALPKGYSLALNAYDDASKLVGEVYKENKSELQPYLQSLNKKINSANPTLKRFIPKFVQEALKENEEESGSSYSSEDPLTGNLKGLDDLFKMQAMQSAEGRMQAAQSEIVEKRRFASEIGVLQELSRGIQRLVAYQDNILINYQRKHLEINYRQFDVSSKLLASTVKYHEDTRDLLKSILKNTGLPDWVKIHSTEVVKQRLQERMADLAANSVGGWVGNYFKTLSGNVKSFAASAGSALGAISQAEQMGMSKATLAGEMAGAMASDIISSKIKGLVESIVAEFAPAIKAVPGVEGLGRTLREKLTDIPLKLNELAQTRDDTSTFSGMIKQTLRDLLPQFRPSNTIEGLGYDNIDKPAVFDELFHKTVIQIIPGYLASIDKWVRTIATGEEQEEAAYSLYTGGFVTRSALDEQHVRMGLKAGVGDVIKTDVERIMRGLGADEKDENGNPLLSEESKKAVRKRLLTSMANGFEFKPSDYVKPTSWSGISEDAAEEIIEFFAEKFGLGIQGNQYIFTDEIDRRRDSVAEMYSDTVKRIPNFAGRMNVLSNTIGRDVWRRLGLSSYDNRKDDIVNFEALHDLLLNSGKVDEASLESVTEQTTDTTLPASLDDIAKRVDEKRKRIVEERKRKLEQERSEVNLDNIDVIGKSKGQLSLERLAGARASGTPTAADVAALERAHYTVNPIVELPEQLTVRDLETHLRLDSLIESVGAQTAVLDHILAAIPLAGSAAAGAAEETPDSPQDRPGFKARTLDWIKSLPGRAGKLLGKTAWGSTRAYGSFVGKAYGAMFSGIGMAAKGAWWAAKAPFTTRLKVGAMDIYVAGETEPALTAKRIRRGEYVDINTRKVISGIKDITGPVMAYGATVEQALTQEEFDRGLVNGEGNSLAGLVGRGAASIGVGAASLLYRYTAGSYGLMGWMAKKIVTTATNQFQQFDAYFPGDKEPRIRSKLLKQSYYRKADGSPILSLKDIDGPVYDIRGNEVISQEEIDQYKTLYTRNGSVLFTIGRGFGSVAGAVGDLAWTGVKAYGKFVGKMYKGMWDVGSSIVKKPFSWMFGKKGGGEEAVVANAEGASDFFKSSLELADSQLQVQREILTSLTTLCADCGCGRPSRMRRNAGEVKDRVTDKVDALKKRFKQRDTRFEKTASETVVKAKEHILEKGEELKAKVTKKAAEFKAEHEDSAAAIVDELKKLGDRFEETLIEAVDTAKDPSEKGLRRRVGRVKRDLTEKARKFGTKRVKELADRAEKFKKEGAKGLIDETVEKKVAEKTEELKSLIDEKLNGKARISPDKIREILPKLPFSRKGKGGGLKDIGKFIERQVGKLKPSDNGEEKAPSAVERATLALTGEYLRVQEEILKTLKDQFAEDDRDKWDLDGDGLRDNSWAAKMKARLGAKGKSVKAGAAAGVEDLVAEIRKLGERLSDEFKSLSETVEDAGEPGLLDQAADLNSIFGDGPGGNERGKRRSGRRGRFGGRPTPRPKKGFFAKLKNPKNWGWLAAAASFARPIFTVLKDPRVLAAAGVVAAAYYGYNWGKNFAARKHPFANLRMNQYGVDPFDETQPKTISALEALVLPGVKVQGGKAAIDPKGFDPAQVFEIFGISQESEHGEHLLQWLATRFRPVFLAHCAASFKINGKVDLGAIDKSTNLQDKEYYLSVVDIRGLGMVYNDVEISPFEEELDRDADDVVDAVNLIKEMLEEERTSANEKQGVVKLNETASIGVQRYKEATKLKVSAKGVDATEAVKFDEHRLGMLTDVKGRIDQKFTKDLTFKSLNLATAVRYKTYGLKTFSIAKVEVLAKLEELFWDKIRYNGTESAFIEGDYDRLEFQAVAILKPVDFLKETEVKYWLKHRFLPTLLQYAVSGRRRFNGDARNIHRSLTPQKLRSVLEETTATSVKIGYGTISVWAITKSPWSDEGVETSPGVVKVYIDSLPEFDAGPLTVEGLRIKSQTGEDSKSFKDKVVNLSEGAGYNAQGKVTGGSGSTIANMKEIYSKATTGQGSATYPAPTVGAGDGSLITAGPLAGSGQEVQHPGGGTGGDINQIPQATGAGWDGVKDTILAAAKMLGFDPAIAATIAGVESTWDPNANVKGGATSAKGLYQFINGTWASMLKTYGAKYGIAPNTPPSDARANAILGIQYLIDNYKYLKKRIGKVTDTSLYMAHFLGPGGAARFLSAPQTASVRQAVEKDSLDANPGVFQIKTRSGYGDYKTVGQVLQDFEAKMARIRKVHGLSNGDAMLSQPSLPSPGVGDQPASPVAAEAAAGGIPSSQGTKDAPTVPPLLKPTEAAPETTARPSIQETAAKAAKAASGAASGNTTAGPIGILAMQKDLTPTPEAPAEVEKKPPVVMPTASTASTTASRDTTAAEMMGNVQGIETLLSKQLNVAVSMDSTLKQIREELSLLASQMGSGKQQPVETSTEPRPGAVDPIPRNPLNTRRSNPVT